MSIVPLHHHETLPYNLTQWDRVAVPNGWLYRLSDTKTISFGRYAAICFVPDPTAWHVILAETTRVRLDDGCKVEETESTIVWKQDSSDIPIVTLYKAAWVYVARHSDGSMSEHKNLLAAVGALRKSRSEAPFVVLTGHVSENDGGEA